MTNGNAETTMRAVMGLGVALGLGFGVLACSPADGGTVPMPEGSLLSQGAAARLSATTQGASTLQGASFVAASLVQGNAHKPISADWDRRKGLAGEVTALSLSTDRSFGAVHVEFNPRFFPDQAVSDVQFTQCNTILPTDLIDGLICQTGCGGAFSDNTSLASSLIQLRDGDGELATAGVLVDFNSDGSAKTSVVLVTRAGQATVGHCTPRVQMVPSDTFLCVADTDCTKYGLDATNGAYTCVNNTCVQQTGCSGDLTCLPPPPASSCADQIQNGNETDTDCGGGTCGPCQPGQMCVLASGCISASCVGGRCQ
jgi:hypothetical protein